MLSENERNCYGLKEIEVSARKLKYYYINILHVFYYIADRFSTLSRSRVWKRPFDTENCDLELRLKVKLLLEWINVVLHIVCIVDILSSCSLNNYGFLPVLSFHQL